MNFLINTCEKKPSIGLLKKDKVQYTELATSSYQVPILWFCLFKETDLIEVSCEYHDGEGNEYVSNTFQPCTTVEGAITNLRNSKSLLLAICNDELIVQGYIDKTLELLTNFDHDYIAMDASQYLILNLEESDWWKFSKCFGSDESTVTYLKEFSHYEDDALPYPVAEFYATPELDDDKRRSSSIAFDPNFANLLSRVKYPLTPVNLATIPVVKKKPWWQFW
ncbi:hypothetical protein J7384_18435 [Endozoicomonas sp. G2_1]|uniref:hypothetical protein n=1 Tax=Endozoicomonas sp. G2_1 TaxID=2821091 RepID=UPI001ADB7C7B|nr:hypothetical protein [Endozoicomonas sp. G2_1]MBO9492346.1 hypothetical protein [Endozoicomonas sp. G2_1]